MTRPAGSPSAFLYEHTDVPPGLTLTAWRGAHTGRRRHRLRATLSWASRLLAA